MVNEHRVVDKIRWQNMAVLQHIRILPLHDVTVLLSTYPTLNPALDEAIKTAKNVYTMNDSIIQDDQQDQNESADFALSYSPLCG